MKLTTVERLILINQYKILEKLYPDEGYGYYREILEQGYTYNYSDMVELISDEMTEEECKEVWDIFDMYRSLQFSFNNLEDKGDLTQDHIKFRGFDGNNESKYMSYARFILKDMGRYREILEQQKNPECTDLNSHFPMLDRYRRMLKRWHEIIHDKMDHRTNLTVEEIKEILKP